MDQQQRTARQRQIAAELHVADDFDAAREIERRVAFLADYLRANGLAAYVLGISGGVDSSTAGRLAQLAVERLRDAHYDARFIAMRLPYGVQHDEADAQQSLAFIRPDDTLTVDIRPAADAMLASLSASGLPFADASQQDFVHGNIKARQRMIAQYAAASARRGIVIGTDHAAESVMGFFTKFGDGGADVLPLAGLTKRRVRALAGALGASDALAHKVPTADLEMLRPQRPDEDAYGIRYDDIDDFLEGMPVSDAVFDTVMRFYDSTHHKRALPYTPFD
ncbi:MULTISPECIES: ammonia-dependent NAD(+) synthetase [Paraburkholderia]|jgi:NAD+ synthase|uniref:ammonia-dependent NAD(+) synthetase n=1 Tax=Paraburkholderia TaxID=1822464 RepID=UPI0006D3C6CC|nr:MULTISPECIES: ammonia-dependent NAD(+) synthetase [Paraburkholderia]ALP64608.1 NAD(+) synthetase [Paraburkholderia caribensis]AMV45098.1 NAD(+) synthetase [Paraburkholderia caribensis]AUT54244.1 ammonia-dependent NAD(+) synthetase [Paraburkholderia caribensis]MDR6386952.1 NAD+ synthase [Paraburkholderia caribensis]CAG9195152.1 NH(3)-dependent NAD(+) synthetase [Paraburkholderia caribensis]